MLVQNTKCITNVNNITQIIVYNERVGFNFVIQVLDSYLFGLVRYLLLQCDIMT